MVNDQEPRYRLVDADGTVVGSLFAESDGTLKLQEGTSGNDNELSLTTQGALEVEQISHVHWTNAYPGSSFADRIQNAINDAVGGDTIILENATLSGSLTVSEEVYLRGFGGRGSANFGPQVSGSLTLSASSGVFGVGADGGTITLSDSVQRVGNLHVGGSGTIEIDGFAAAGGTITGGGNLTLTSNSQNCVIGPVSRSVTVTDNGSNNRVLD